jgi:hypothetical protein
MAHADIRNDAFGPRHFAGPVIKGVPQRAANRACSFVELYRAEAKWHHRILTGESRIRSEGLIASSFIACDVEIFYNAIARLDSLHRHSPLERSQSQLPRNNTSFVTRGASKFYDANDQSQFA